MLAALNFPTIHARFSHQEKTNPQIFDIVRKKFVDLTPEEWVRQHVVHFLVYHRDYPLSLLAVEKQLKLNNTVKRTDLVVYNKALKPMLLVECKSDNVNITQEVVDQALRYNVTLQVPYILLTNGLQHVCFYFRNGEAVFLKEIPAYAELVPSDL